MLYYLLGLYFLGVVCFLLFEQEFVFGNWLQILLTALLWPVLVGYLLVNYVFHWKEIQCDKKS